MYQIKAGERETYQKSVSLPPKAGELASLRLIQFLSKVFLHKNIQLELTKHCWALTSSSRYGNDNTKCCYKQYIGRQNTKTEQNFNPGLALISLSGTGPSSLGHDMHFLVTLCKHCLHVFMGSSHILLHYIKLMHINFFIWLSHSSTKIHSQIQN